jgi:hypothetical protein
MTSEKQPDAGALKDALGAGQNYVETTKNAIAEVLVHSPNVADQSVGRALKGVTGALGSIGALASVGLGYAQGKNVGAAAAAAGVLAGLAVTGPGVAAITFGGPALLAAGVTAAVVGNLAAGITIATGIGSFFAGNAVEKMTKDWL